MESIAKSSLKDVSKEKIMRPRAVRGTTITISFCLSSENSLSLIATT